ncbi:MAG: hypothetical protein O3B72_02735 [Proteobacteria bacterium]|nr:hypothetical protein [Pseudomonadota bacterium]
MIQQARQAISGRGGRKQSLLGLLLLCATLFTAQALATVHELDVSLPTHVECTLCATTSFNHDALVAAGGLPGLNIEVQQVTSLSTLSITEVSLPVARARAPPRY